MPKLITAFECSFCGGRKILKTMGSAIYHERRCMKNPALKTCRTCLLNIDHVTHIDERGVYHVDGYDCADDHKPAGVKIVYGCNYWIDRLEEMERIA